MVKRMICIWNEEDHLNQNFLFITMKGIPPSNSSIIFSGTIHHSWWCCFSALLSTWPVLCSKLPFRPACSLSHWHSFTPIFPWSSCTYHRDRIYFSLRHRTGHFRRRSTRWRVPVTNIFGWYKCHISLRT